jgi:anaerobic magnesium-protoporphyrin IX monomethyl ester cyclase
MRRTVAFLFIVHTYEREHLGVMLISAALKEQGIPVTICLARDKAMRQSLEDLTQAFDVVVVGFSVPSVFFAFYERINKKLKKDYSYISYFGGPHPTFFPDIIKHEDIDVVCRGEGVYPTLELAHALSESRSYEHIQNLYVKKGDTTVKNVMRPLKDDLDTLPFADRDLFRKNIRGGNPHNMILVASRGCPYDCSYCFSHAFRKIYDDTNIYARRSVQSVISEISNCRERYDIGFISFCDSIFTLDVSWLSEFADLYRKKISLPFYCNVHPQCVDDERIRLLALAGCSVVGIGIESGDERVRTTILRRPISDICLIEACRIIKQHGLKIASGNIIGIPESEVTDDLKTVMLNIQCKVDFPEVFVMSLHPGTDIFKRTVLDQSNLQSAVSLLQPTVNSLGVFYPQTKRFTTVMEKRMVSNLQYLFVVFVTFPFLYRCSSVLLKLPLTKVYMLLFTFLEGVKQFSYKRNCKNLIPRLLIQWFIIIDRLRNYESFDNYK